MIISLKYNYIYIRTRKTGSTSIESILRDNLGPDDIIVSKSLESLEPVLRPGAVVPDHDGLITHVPISLVHPLIREDIWQRSFKFTSERHPYEKVLSFARFRLEQMGPIKSERVLHSFKGFGGYVDSVVRRGQYSSYRYYSIDGEAVVDDYIRLESLQADMHRIGERIGIEMPDEMPHRRNTGRGEDRPAREFFTDEQKQIVYEHCRHEFDVLGYER